MGVDRPGCVRLGATNAKPVRRIIDITAGLTEDLVTWPGVVERFERRPLSSLAAGDPMTVSSFQLGAHAGTHVDAPCHFLPNAAGVESVPLDALIGPAHVVEIPPNEPLVTAGILELSGAPRNVLRLLARTSNSGWSKNGGPFREDSVSGRLRGVR